MAFPQNKIEDFKNGSPLVRLPLSKIVMGRTKQEMTQKQKIPEHYHVGWINKKNKIFEVVVTTDNRKGWDIIDDWGI